jgi:hypothetical protein
MCLKNDFGYLRFDAQCGSDVEVVFVECDAYLFTRHSTKNNNIANPC